MLVRDLIVNTGLSFRGAAAALALIAQRWGVPLRMPSFSTMRTWMMRLGCYALCGPLQRNVPWVWMIDHTLQVGDKKLFAILGCPRDAVPLGERSLSVTDMHLIALVPMTSSTHQQVDAELERAVARTGVPRVIVSDHAGDVKKGIEQFKHRHPETAQVHDVAHYGANVLENRWERDPRWHAFLAQLNTTNQTLRQTAQAHLLAPVVRAKARFMNVGPVVRFANRVLGLLDRPTPDPHVEQKYGWLREYRADLTGWSEQHRVVQTTIDHVRRHGVSGATEGQLEHAWGQLSDGTGTAMVAGHMRVYARKYGAQARAGEALVASTDVLESSFGKLKRLEGDVSRGGFTGLVLALGAVIGEPNDDTVREAMECVPEKKAEGWVKRTLGTTVGWLRRQVLGPK